MDKVKKGLLWLVIGLLGLSMIFAGGSKLFGVAELHVSFQTMGLPSWFGYFIGLCEFAAGVALFLPGYRALAAAGLIPIMLGAAYYHIAYDVPSAIPALVFLVMCVALVVLFRKKAVWFPI